MYCFIVTIKFEFPDLISFGDLNPLIRFLSCLYKRQEATLKIFRLFIPIVLAHS